MRRRQVIGGLGVALARPIAARAQPPSLPVIGFLRAGSFEGAGGNIAGFRQGLGESGYVEGRNVAIEFRSAGGQVDRLPALVDDLLRRPVAVIVGNPPAALVAKGATTTIPILFASGGDPVSEGLVTSLSRPGGNVTGVTFLNSTLGAKQLELLRELVPAVTAVGFLADATNTSAIAATAEVQAAARALGIHIVVANVAGDRDIEAAFANVGRQQVGAVVSFGASLFASRRGQIVALAAEHALPAIYDTRDYVAAGGLMSYGGSVVDAYRQVGIYAGRILGGASPADLPVVQSTRLELAINLRTARALGLTIPPILLARADEVIE
jgi:putative ABC transport system substrate-binding protein